MIVILLGPLGRDLFDSPLNAMDKNYAEVLKDSNKIDRKREE
jgi:hypothetical protein